MHRTYYIAITLLCATGVGRAFGAEASSPSKSWGASLRERWSSTRESVKARASSVEIPTRSSISEWSTRVRNSASLPGWMPTVSQWPWSPWQPAKEAHLPPSVSIWMAKHNPSLAIASTRLWWNSLPDSDRRYYRDFAITTGSVVVITKVAAAGCTSMAAPSGPAAPAVGVACNFASAPMAGRMVRLAYAHYGIEPDEGAFQMGMVAGAVLVPGRAILALKAPANARSALLAQRNARALSRVIVKELEKDGGMPKKGELGLTAVGGPVGPEIAQEDASGGPRELTGTPKPDAAPASP